MSDIKILSRGEDTVTIEAVGDSAKLDDIEKLLDGYGILEIIRSGPICVTKMIK
jgi:acetolactate synthase small subunit